MVEAWNPSQTLLKIIIGPVLREFLPFFLEMASWAFALCVVLMQKQNKKKDRIFPSR
jgi:hypothetical protein